ncbi:hypothetical protein ACFSTE_00850 [Aquimarina hainanensis]|uniref:Collagen triple helix repeat-containing protein n=1 Tax=Aquimarina hainanensis TaxID=1578017 RepID=A0ABW5N185_9FLAO
MRKQLLIKMFLFVFAGVLFSCSEDGADGKNGKDGIDGIDGKDGKDGKDGEDGEDGGSSTYIVLSGDITDDAAAKKLEDINEYTEVILIKNTSNLTRLHITKAVDLVRLEINNNEKLTSIEIEGLEEVYDYVKINKNPLLEQVNMASLSSVENFLFTNNKKITALSLNLEEAFGTVYIDNNEKLESASFPRLKGNLETSISISDNMALIAMEFPELSRANSIRCYDNVAIEQLDFPALITLEDGIHISNHQSLLGVSFPVLETAKDSYISRNNNLTDIDFSKLQTIERFDLQYSWEDGVIYDVNSLKLSSLIDFKYIDISSRARVNTADIDALFAHLLTVAPIITGKSISLAGTPSAQGDVDIQSFIDNGNTVNIYNP